LGSYLRLVGFFQPLEQTVHLKQKALKYTPIQKVEMLFVALLAGAQAVSHVGTSLRVDPALQRAFGLPGCADQSGIAATLDVAREGDVAALREAIAASFRRYGEAVHHDFGNAVLVLDLDLSPLPSSKSAEGSERGYMGRCRSKTGRKLVRVRAAATGEIVFEEVLTGRSVETLAVVQMAVEAAERLLDLEGESAKVQAKRARTEWRLDGGWGTEEIISWLLARGYQVTGKFKSASRVRKLVRGITAWEATSSPGRAVAPVAAPVPFARPLRQYAVRTPSQEKKHADGYYYAVLFSSREDLGLIEVVAHYDNRAGMEADLKADKHGLGLAVLRKHKLAAQKVVVLLAELAHNVLLWSRAWLAERAPRLRQFGIVRLVREVWAVPGRVKLVDERLTRLRLNPEHPRARDVARGLGELLAPGQTLGV
jgi:hypothetical protein